MVETLVKHPHRKSVVAPDYDWKAYHQGNIIQKWWKNQIVVNVHRFLATPRLPNSLLDVGCGSSPLLSIMSTIKLNKVGIDIDDEKIQLMRTLDKSSEYYHGDVRNIPFESNTFESVTCIEVLEHLEDREELHLAISELKRVSTNKIIIATPDFSRWQWRATEFMYNLIMTKGYKGDHTFHPTMELLKDLSKELDLTVGRHEYVGGGDLVLELLK